MFHEEGLEAHFIILLGTPPKLLRKPERLKENRGV